MGIFARKRKSSLVYYVSFTWSGKRIQEHAGTDKRVAQQLERQRKREVRDGTYLPDQQSMRPSLAEYAEQWLARRRTRTAGDDKARLHLHVLPTLGTFALDEIRPKHIRALVESLRDANSISPKTIRNVYGTLRTVFRDAVIDELVLASPCVLPKGTLPSPSHEEKQIYSLEHVDLLLSSPRIPHDRRVFYALAALTGMRHGEAAGRRWRHYDAGAQPLACLEVGTQYNDRPLKTSTEKSRPRRVPVHSKLALMLEEWRTEGFPLYFGRLPEPNDFIVPSRRGPTTCRAVRSSLKKLVADCTHVGVPPLTFHRLRDTFISLARRGGARKDVLERVTHNAAGDIIDRYTSFDWQPLCEAVSCLKISDSKRPFWFSTRDVWRDAGSARLDFLSYFATFLSGADGTRNCGIANDTAENLPDRDARCHRPGARTDASRPTRPRAVADRGRVSPAWDRALAASLQAAAGDAAANVAAELDGSDARLVASLERATAAGNWPLAEMLARELGARRTERAGVVELRAVRQRR